MELHHTSTVNAVDSFKDVPRTKNEIDKRAFSVAGPQI